MKAPLVTVAPLTASQARDWLLSISPVRISIAAIPMPGDSTLSVFSERISFSENVIVTVRGPLCPVTVAVYVPGLKVSTTSALFPEA